MRHLSCLEPLSFFLTKPLKLPSIQSRSASSKASKSSEKEHRAVLDIVLQDVLTVLYWPEWPAASQVLMWFCKLMVSALGVASEAGRES